MDPYDTKQVLYLTFELFVAILSIFGNALVSFAFLRDRSLRTPTNLFVFSLAVTDLLTSAVATPLYVRSMITRLPRDFLSCVCVQSLILTFCTVSIFHLTAVSFDRYRAIVFQRKPVSHARGMRRASSYIACAWILGILVGCLPLMGWNAGGESAGVESMPPRCEFMKVISMRYLMFLFFATILAPTLVMTFFYGSIFYAVRKQHQRMMSTRFSVDSRASFACGSIDRSTTIGTSSSILVTDRSIELASTSTYSMSQVAGGRSCCYSSTPPLVPRMISWQKRQSVKTKKIILSLFLVIICFLGSWYPLYVMNAVAYYCESCRFEDWWFYGPIIISHMSSVLNPLIYARTMPGYKEAFVETLTCGRIVPKPDGYGKRRSAIITDYNPRRTSSITKV